MTTTLLWRQLLAQEDLPLLRRAREDATMDTTPSLLEQTPGHDNDTMMMNESEGAVENDSSTIDMFLAVGLFLIMVGVGMNFRPELFRKMFNSPKALQSALIGVCCQFVIMPVVSYLLTLIFQVDGYTALGFILVGCMPGGSASNVVTMWSQGVLELSVFMSIVSTLLAFAFTPLWLWIFSQLISGMEDASLAFDQIAITFAFLILPLGLGMACNWLAAWSRQTLSIIERCVTIMAIAVFVTALVMLAVDNPHVLRDHANWKIYVAGFIFFPTAAGLSAVATSLLHFAPALRRTVVLEVGLQNLTLAFAIGVRSVSYQSQLEQALPLPFIYAISMYLWVIVLVPLFQWHKRYNDRHGVQDNDPNFFLTAQEEQDSSSNHSNQKQNRKNTEEDSDADEPEENPA